MSPKAAYDAGLRAAQSGDLESALDFYGQVFHRDPFLSALPGFVDSVMALGDDGERLIRKFRDFWQLQIVQGRCRHSTVQNLMLLNEGLNDPEYDVRYYEELFENPKREECSMLFCLGAIMSRLNKLERHQEIRKYAIPFVDELERLVARSARHHIPAGHGLVCVRSAVDIGDHDLIYRAALNLLLFCASQCIYFELKKMAKELPSDTIRLALVAVFESMEPREKLKIIVSERFFQIDPEGFALIGCPPDEYSSEAAALVETLCADTNAEQIQNNLERIWLAQFGTYYQVKGDHISEPREIPDYKPPDLSNAAEKIFESVAPYLQLLK